MATGGRSSVELSRLDQQILEIVSDLAAELHLDCPPEQIGPTSLLERDLGIYSLERLELILRLEKASGVHLPADATIDARRVGDLACLITGRSVPDRDHVATAFPTVSGNRTAAPPGSLAFTLYVGLVALLIGGAVWPLLHVLPHGPRAASLLRRAARALLRATGCPLEVAGLHHLDGATPAVLVANHQSYVDAIVLLAVLPILPNILVNEWLPGAPLIRTGIRAARYLTVDRRSVRARLTCAEAMIAALRAGESLLVFPEATFPPGPGLLPFRLGAFAAAASAGRPVVPITLRGTRGILPWGATLLTRNAISVTIHTPMDPGGSTWHEALRLRRLAREQIAQALHA